jgi:hypothetical protein
MSSSFGDQFGDRIPISSRGVAWIRQGILILTTTALRGDEAEVLVERVTAECGPEGKPGRD